VGYLIKHTLRTSQSKFSMKTEITPGGLSKIINQGLKPGVDSIENIAKAYPHINLEWLITGKGTPLKSSLCSEHDIRNHPLFKAMEERIAKLERMIANLLLGDAGKSNQHSSTAPNPEKFPDWELSGTGSDAVRYHELVPS
jgi:hypothetical protein